MVINGLTLWPLKRLILKIISCCYLVVKKKEKEEDGIKVEALDSLG